MISNIIVSSAKVIIGSCRGNPVLSVLLVFFYYLGFSSLEAAIEKLIWGDRFVHWLDPVIIIAFGLYSGFVVYGCFVHNKR